MWEVHDFGRRWEPELADRHMQQLSSTQLFEIEERNKTLEMEIIYFSPCFLISSPFKYLSKCEVQKGGQSDVKDQRAKSTLFDLHEISCLEGAHQVLYQ